MKSAAETAAEIAARAHPIIFIDTCTILDLTARNLREDKFSMSHARAAMDIIRLAKTGKLTNVLPEQVLIEYRDNVSEAEAKSIGLVAQMNRQMPELIGIMRAYEHGVPGYFEVAVDTFTAAFSVVMDALMAASITFRTTDAAKLRDSDRVIDRRAPASSTKQSFKDCLILESCFETLDAARALGFSNSAFFLSSNTSEYTYESKKLRSDLIAEFEAHKLNYVKTFAELRYHPAIKDL